MSQSSKGVFGRRKGRTEADGDDHGYVDGLDVPTDRLTGLATRASLEKWVTEAVAHSNRSSARALVAFLDLGLMRNVNDTYGPDTGDALLRGVADRLRAIDVPNTRVVRWEGTQFALVFEKLTTPDAGQKIAEFLVELLAPAFQIGHDSISIETHVGAALSDESYDHPSDMIRDALQSLVEAREQGPGGIIVWDESRRTRYAMRITDELLLAAIEGDEFLLHWQPIVRLIDDGLVGAEGLIRWSAPGATNIGVLYPHDFLPQLEKSGLIVPVGKWVVRETCRQVAEWNRESPHHRAIFGTCNLGARQLAQTDFRETVVAAIEETGVAPEQLCLQLTEVALRYNRTGVWASLRDLKDMGVRLALDDFGSGESSVSYLREFAVDLIHLDKRFVDGVRTSREDRAIVHHLSALAHDLDMQVVAEGVEEPETKETLAGLGVDLAMGWLFGKPEPASVVSLLLKPEEERRPTGWDPSAVMEEKLLEHPDGHLAELEETSSTDPRTDPLHKRGF